MDEHSYRKNSIASTERNRGRIDLAEKSLLRDDAQDGTYTASTAFP